MSKKKSPEKERIEQPFSPLTSVKYAGNYKNCQLNEIVKHFKNRGLKKVNLTTQSKD